MRILEEANETVPCISSTRTLVTVRRKAFQGRMSSRGAWRFRWRAGFVGAIVLLAPSILRAEAKDCPSRAQIEMELRRMGESAALEQFRASKVTVEGESLRIIVRDRAGGEIGVREVDAPRSCEQRAAVSALVLAAWSKTWDSELEDESRIPEPSPPTSRPAEIALAAAAYWDGNGPAIGLGLTGAIPVRGALSIAFIVDGVGERSVSLGPGVATYSRGRLGAGLTFRAGGRSPWADFGLSPAIEWQKLGAAELPRTRTHTVWGASGQARLRIGVSFARVAPFTYLAVSRAIVQERLTLDDAPDSILLSPWDVGLGAGLAVLFDTGD